MSNKHASDSTPQQEAEVEVRKLLKRERPEYTFEPETIQCGDARVEVDIVVRTARDRVVELIDVYARQDKLAGGQLKKPTDDAARLKLAAEFVDWAGKPVLRLAWCSEVPVEQVKRSWRGAALKQMGVEIFAVPLSPESVEKIAAAQERQRR